MEPCGPLHPGRLFRFMDSWIKAHGNRCRRLEVGKRPLHHSLPFRLHPPVFGRPVHEVLVTALSVSMGLLAFPIVFWGALYPQAFPLDERFGRPRYNWTALALHTHQDRGVSPSLDQSIWPKSLLKKSGMKANRKLEAFKISDLVITAVKKCLLSAGRVP